MTYAERLHAQTRREIAALRNIKSRIGYMIKSVTITVNGRKFTVHNEAEADEVLEAFSDW